MGNGLRKIALLHGGLVVRGGGQTVTYNGDGTIKGAKPKTAQKPLAPETTDKGAYNGLCNRSACLAPLGAGNTGNYWNRYTRFYYCRRCAHLINYKEAICMEVGPEDARPDLSHI